MMENSVRDYILKVKSYALADPKIGAKICKFQIMVVLYPVITMASTVGYDLLTFCPCKKEPFYNRIKVNSQHNESDSSLQGL